MSIFRYLVHHVITVTFVPKFHLWCKYNGSFGPRLQKNLKKKKKKEVKENYTAVLVQK